MVEPVKGLIIKNIKIYEEQSIIENGSIATIGERISDIRDLSINLNEHTAQIDTSSLTTIDGQGQLFAIPGFIDSHIHGAYGADIMDGTPTALEKLTTMLPREGTTSFLATTITQSPFMIEKALKNIAQFKNKPGSSEILGIHLEGPFIEESKAGAQPKEYIIPPSLEEFRHWQQLSNHLIRTITIAPEKDVTGKFIRELRQQDINVSAGHTNATFTELQQGVSNGVRQMTHLCNAMNGIHHRDIGAVGGAFLLKKLRSELIVDGIHVSPEMVELIYNNIGPERLILITDSIRAKGLVSGTYDLGGQSVLVDGKEAKLQNGSLAGSVLFMNDSLKNMMNYTGASIRDVITMASANPAKQINMYKRKGSITVGKDADIILMDKDFNIKYTICRGQVAYRG